MKKWAKEEVELACKQLPEEEGKLYAEALKIYNRLIKNCESVYDRGKVLALVRRMLNEIVLTPITENEEWIEVEGCEGEWTCKRMPTVRRMKTDGDEYKYSHYGRVVSVDDTTGLTYKDALTTRIADEYFPITLPYFPNGNRDITIYTHDFSTSEDDVYDTVFIKELSVKGDRLPIERYFKAGENDWIEIDEEEYKERQRLANEG